MKLRKGSMTKRASGILLHPTSLPSRFGIGDLGPAARSFADFLAEGGQSFWQVLPVNPPRADHYSPYLSPSTFAGNTLLISPELLVEHGLIDREDLRAAPPFPAEFVDFPSVVAFKKQIFSRAFESFQTSGAAPDYEAFCRKNSYWLDDFALFTALQSHYKGKVWSEWPLSFRDRRRDAIEEARQTLEPSIDFEKFLQYEFHRQWSAWKGYCNEIGVNIIGDVPIYVDYDAADVWTQPALFKLDEAKRPRVVSGVPPDYFSTTGQLWGHPIYDWEVFKQSRYDWWLKRLEHNLTMCDIVRIDHFRGLVGYWEVPAGEKTAINGEWVKGPGEDFFRLVVELFPSAPIIAEDLGIITPDVTELRRAFRFPGMKILLFAFGDDSGTNPYLPHNLEKNCVAYTGTHDNNTAKGWFEREASVDERRRLLDYIGRDVDPSGIHWDMMRLLMMSVADIVIFPVQDILGLGQEARMNVPSTTKGNWRWRVAGDLLTSELTEKLRKMTKTYGRADRIS